MASKFLVLCFEKPSLLYGSAMDGWLGNWWTIVYGLPDYFHDSKMVLSRDGDRTLLIVVWRKHLAPRPDSETSTEPASSLYLSRTSSCLRVN